MRTATGVESGCERPRFLPCVRSRRLFEHYLWSRPVSAGSGALNQCSERCVPRHGSEKILPGPKYLRSSGELMTTLATTTTNNVATGAGRHTCPESVFLRPTANIWLIRALHSSSPNHVSNGRCQSGSRSPRCRGKGRTRRRVREPNQARRASPRETTSRDFHARFDTAVDRARTSRG